MKSPRESRPVTWPLIGVHNIKLCLYLCICPSRLGTWEVSEVGGLVAFVGAVAAKRDAKRDCGRVCGAAVAFVVKPGCYPHCTDAAETAQRRRLKANALLPSVR